MSDKVITGIVGILTAIIGVAIIAVLVSRNSQTAGVIGAAGSAFGNIVKTAVSPVSGGNGAGFGFGGLPNFGGYGFPSAGINF